ncbi:hypothetical protein ABE525_17465 [Pseudomonas wadenswilerensis]|uniref:hypothetical protein n=1 Tax=Pseudomonas TaxID=286 RepID=UPI000FB126A3|nr:MULTISPECIES: hypothetical protein [Pseudomonas]MCE5984495.1 hypothetical protein [Pseudomonas sp. LF19]UVM19871.1 hypothetical protein LOY45_15545 [Pseudomonas wadenswilerensis]
MGDWSDYFEDFPEENPANEVRQPGPLERVKSKHIDTVRKNSLKECKEVQKLLDEVFARKKDGS